MLVLGFPLGFSMSGDLQRVRRVPRRAVPDRAARHRAGLHLQLRPRGRRDVPDRRGLPAARVGAMVFGALGYGIAVLALLGLPETRGIETDVRTEGGTHDDLTLTNPRRSPRRRRASRVPPRHRPTDHGLGHRLHPDQPDRGARGLGLRRPAVLHSATRSRARCSTSPIPATRTPARRGRGPAHRPAALPGLAERRAGRRGRPTRPACGAATWSRFRSAAASRSRPRSAAEGVPLRHVEQGRNVAMYVTNRQCGPAGRLFGPMVVSMRQIPEDRVDDAIRMTRAMPAVHGAPVHVGDPARAGDRGPRPAGLRRSGGGGTG